MSEDLSVVKNKVDSSLPLTREEMAVYFTCLTQTVNAFAKALQDRQEEQNKAFISILEEQAQQQKEFFNRFDRMLSEGIKSRNSSTPLGSDVSTYLPAVFMKQLGNPMFVSTLDRKDTSAWLRKAYSDVEMLRVPMRKSKTQVLGEIYSSITKKGTDINRLFEEYVNTTGKRAKIKMISESDILREKFEKTVDSLKKRYIEGNTYKSAQVLLTPKVIYETAKPVLRNSNSDNAGLRAIYKKMSELTNVDLNELCKKYAQSIGYSRCCKGYMISQNKYLMKLFKDAVASLSSQERKSA